MVASTVDIFEEHRSRLFGIAYRMLGTVADAEDIVQEAWLRWQSAAHEEIRSARAFLMTVVTRLALNQLDSARRRREEYVGPWLPEPIVAPAGDAAARAESLSMAFLVMMDRLSPAERAVFLLREVFDCEYSEIAGSVGKTEANCRQILKRARERLGAARPAAVPGGPERREVAERFGRVVRSGDLPGLKALLSAEAVMYCDGGGRRVAARNPILGPDRIARFLLGVTRKLPNGVARPLLVNGQPGVAVFDGPALDSVLTLDISGGVIHGLFLVRNPDKLAHLEKTLAAET